MLSAMISNENNSGMTGTHTTIFVDYSLQRYKNWQT
jgi:hypothetical protein